MIGSHIKKNLDLGHETNPLMRKSWSTADVVMGIEPNTSGIFRWYLCCASTTERFPGLKGSPDFDQRLDDFAQVVVVGEMLP